MFESNVTVKKTNLFVFLGHPLVPTVQHLQPFRLPLSQHLDWDFFGAVGTKDDKSMNPNNEPYCKTVCVKKFKTERNKEIKKNAIDSWSAQETTSGKEVVHLHSVANYKKKKKKKPRKIEIFPLFCSPISLVSTETIGAAIYTQSPAPISNNKHFNQDIFSHTVLI